MELSRKRGAAVNLLFPIVDTSGAVVTAASALDSEVAWWDDSTATTGFLDCTNESTETSAFGWYKLTLTSDEMAHDYVAVKVDGDNANIIEQNILINTADATSDGFPTASQTASAVWGWSTRSISSYSCASLDGDSVMIKTSDIGSTIWNWSTDDDERALSSYAFLASDVWTHASRGITSFSCASLAGDSAIMTLASDVWVHASRGITSFSCASLAGDSAIGTLASDVWAEASRTLSTGFLPADMASATWGWSTRGLTSLDDISCAVWAFSTRGLSTYVASSDMWSYVFTALTSVDAPSATPDGEAALMMLYMALRNQRITNTSYDYITGDDGAIMLQASVSDVNTTFARGEWSTI